jgi:hypothetical protein
MLFGGFCIAVGFHDLALDDGCLELTQKALNWLFFRTEPLLNRGFIDFGAFFD